MSLESDADRLAYLQAVGEQISVNGQTLWAVPDNAYVDVLDLAAGTRPQAIVRTADVPNIAPGQTVVMQGTQYSVAEIQPDGTGMTTLILQKT
jgi:hypothetical protein